MENIDLDIDFVLFGPFSSIKDAYSSCGTMVNDSKADDNTCSFSESIAENFTLKTVK